MWLFHSFVLWQVSGKLMFLQHCLATALTYVLLRRRMCCLEVCFILVNANTCLRSITWTLQEVVNAMKNTFHMGCFLCCQCHQPIGTGSFHNEDGKIYCPKGIQCRLISHPCTDWVEYNTNKLDCLVNLCYVLKYWVESWSLPNEFQY